MPDGGHQAAGFEIGSRFQIELVNDSGDGRADHALADALLGQRHRGGRILHPRLGGRTILRRHQRLAPRPQGLELRLRAIDALLGLIHFVCGGGLFAEQPQERVVLLLSGRELQLVALFLGREDAQIGGPAAALDDVQIRPRLAHAGLRRRQSGSRLAGIELDQRRALRHFRAALNQDGRDRSHALGPRLGPFDRLNLAVGRHGAGDGFAFDVREGHLGRLAAQRHQHPRAPAQQCHRDHHQ